MPGIPPHHFGAIACRHAAFRDHWLHAAFPDRLPPGHPTRRALLRHLADVAVRRGCARLEWWVLRTNEPALRFYRRLRARPLDEIEIHRVDGDALHDLAAPSPAAQPTLDPA